MPLCLVPNDGNFDPVAKEVPVRSLCSKVASFPLIEN